MTFNEVVARYDDNHLVVKLERLAPSDVDRATTVGAALLLVLLLGESLSTSN